MMKIIQPSDMKAWAPLQEGAGTTCADRSGNGNDLTFGGTSNPTWANDGKIGKCLSFPGGDSFSGAYAVKESPVNLNVTTLTVAIWMRPGAYENRYRTMFCRDGASGTVTHDAWALVLSSSGNFPIFYVTFADVTNMLLQGPAAYSVDRWSRIVGVIEAGNKISLAKDGVIIAQQSTTKNVNTNPNIPLSIGSYKQAGAICGFGFLGLLAQPTFHARAWSEKEIAYDYFSKKHLYGG